MGKKIMKKKIKVLKYTDLAGIIVPEETENSRQNFAKCPFCDSDNVCWNGLHDELPNWSHECLDCSGVFMSMEKVLNGKPYADLIPKEWDRKDMKLTWSKDRQSVILIARTPAEIAFCELFLEGMNYARYATIKKGRRIIKAKYSVIPDEESKA